MVVVRYERLLVSAVLFCRPQPSSHALHLHPQCICMPQTLLRQLPVILRRSLHRTQSCLMMHAIASAQKLNTFPCGSLMGLHRDCVALLSASSSPRLQHALGTAAKTPCNSQTLSVWQTLIRHKPRPFLFYILHSNLWDQSSVLLLLPFLAIPRHLHASSADVSALCYSQMLST